jgi:hypothetical protein
VPIPEVEAHAMSEFEFRVRELERRMGKVEDATAAIPVIQRDMADVKDDVSEVKDDTRSLRRALYTTALSIVGASVLFALTANELFK